jgi:P pilus assembly protein, pilin FimA
MKPMQTVIHLSALLCLLMGSRVVLAGDPVSLNVTGNITASPCQISSKSISQEIDLGHNIQTSAMQAAGSVTNWVNFTIDLESCPPGTTSATMTLHGNADSAEPDDLYQNSGSASNVAVQVQSQQGDLLGDGKTITGKISNGAYSYPLHARMYSKNGNVGSGTVSATMTATFTWQ